MTPSKNDDDPNGRNFWLHPRRGGGERPGRKRREASHRRGKGGRA